MRVCIQLSQGVVRLPMSTGHTFSSLEIRENTMPQLPRDEVSPRDPQLGYQGPGVEDKIHQPARSTGCRPSSAGVFTNYSRPGGLWQHISGGLYEETGWYPVPLSSGGDLRPPHSVTQSGLLTLSQAYSWPAERDLRPAVLVLPGGTRRVAAASQSSAGPGPLVETYEGISLSCL